MLLPNLQLQETGLSGHMKGNTYFPMTVWHSFPASSHFSQTSSSFVWKQCANSLQFGHSTDTSSPFPYHWLYPRAPCNSCGRKILLHLFDSEGIERFAQSHRENEGNQHWDLHLLSLVVQLNPSKHNCPPTHPSEMRNFLLTLPSIHTMCTNYYLFLCSI